MPEPILKEPLSHEEVLMIRQKINELYIMSRDKHLVMYTDKSGETKWNFLRQKLTDRVVNKHIIQESTIGVFSGRVLTKFICFDIDSSDIEYSKNICHYLNYILVGEFRIPKESLVVSFSGRKGYHVEIFLSEAIGLEIAEQFFKSVKDYIFDNATVFGDVEFRPTHKQGVKLPLSINKDTNRVCWYVDTDTLEEIKDPMYITSIKTLDVEYFKYKVMDNLLENVAPQKKNFSLEHGKAENTEYLLHNTNPNFKTSEEFIQDCMEILDVGHLLRNGTRNNATLQLAILLKEQGNALEDTKTAIKNVLDNTWNNHRSLISPDTEYTYMMSEVDRISKYVYKKEIFQTKDSYDIYKSELVKILELPNKTLQNLMFSLYIHSKKYAKQNGEFYMAYSVMTKMGNTGNRTRLLQSIMELESHGYVSIIQRNKINTALTTELSKSHNKVIGRAETNIYRVNLKPSLNDTHFSVNIRDEINFIESVVKLIPEKETKEKLSKTQFYTTYKESYQKANQ